MAPGDFPAGMVTGSVNALVDLWNTKVTHAVDTVPPPPSPYCLCDFLVYCEAKSDEVGVMMPTASVK